MTFEVYRYKTAISFAAINQIESKHFQGATGPTNSHGQIVAHFECPVAKTFLVLLRGSEGLRLRLRPRLRVRVGLIVMAMRTVLAVLTID